MDDAKCFETVRQLRWPNGVKCSAGGSAESAKRGFHAQQTARQRAAGRACPHHFDALTDTLFERPPPPWRVWGLCLYFRGLNLSPQQIAAELDLRPSEVQAMTTQLREGGVSKKARDPERRN